MITLKKITELLFTHVGLMSIFMGVGFLVFGTFNIGSIPRFYEALSGDPGFDGEFTILINAITWFLLCTFLMLIGLKLYLKSKEFSKIEVKRGGLNGVHLCLIGGSIEIGTIIYIALLLLNLLKPLQFYPHVSFVTPDTPMDFSIIMNTILFNCLISVLHRVGGKFITRGIKLGGVK